MMGAYTSKSARTLRAVTQHPDAVVLWTPETGWVGDRNETVAEIRAALKRRSGKAWSVKGGRGTSWGWLTITAPPARLVQGSMTDDDRAELSALLGKEVHHQGDLVPPQTDYRAEYVDRANGRAPARVGVPAWD